MRKLATWCALLALPLAGLSQRITVMDKDSGEPLEMVALSSDQPAATVLTDENGHADISAMSGSELIRISVVGYEQEELSFNQLRNAKFNLFLVPNSTHLEEVVYAGSRWEQTSTDQSSSITTITTREVILQNPQTAADMLGISGKVFIQKSQQGGGSPMIRGFATNRLLYSIDGVRMNTAIFRSGNLQNVISLDPFAISRTEVLFGPASVMYGSDALGGVMSFQTLSPELSDTHNLMVTGNAVTRYSSANDEKTGHVDVSLGWKRWGLLSSITYNDFDHLKMGGNGPEEYLRPFYVQRWDSADVVVNNEDTRVQRPSGYSQINMMQKVRFSPNGRWNFEYGFHNSETSDYARYDRHIRYKNDLPRYGEWSYGPQKWMMNSLNIKHNAQKGMYDQMRITLAHQKFQESRYSRDINKTAREIRIEDVQAFSGNIDFMKRLGEGNTLYYGMEAVHNGVKSEGIDEDISSRSSSEGAARYPNSQWASAAVYVSDQYRINDMFTLQAGARYSHFLLHADFDTTFYPFPFTKADMNNGAVTGNLGVVFRPSQKWVIKASGATAFRAPNVDDMGKVFDSEPGSVVVPNPDLKAEYSYNAELTVAKIFGNIVRLEVTGYYTNLKNALVRRDYTLDGMDSIMYDGSMSKVQAVQNAANAYVYGVQVGVEAYLRAGFKVSSDFNYQKGEEELDDGSLSPSRHVAPWYGVTRISYRTRNLEVQLYSMYSGAVKFEDLPVGEASKDYLYAVDENGNPWSPSWYTLNFKASYSLTDYLTVTAGLENITDQRYRPYSSGLVAPGRNFILGLRANF